MHLGALSEQLQALGKADRHHHASMPLRDSPLEPSKRVDEVPAPDEKPPTRQSAEAESAAQLPTKPVERSSTSESPRKAAGAAEAKRREALDARQKHAEDYGLSLSI